MAEQYDLASGFQTLIRSSDAIASEIRSLRSTITASMDMAQRFGGQNTGSQGAAPTAPLNTGQANPNAGQTTSVGGGQTTFEGVRQAAMGLVMNQVNRAVRGAQPSSGPFAPGGSYGGGSGGWSAPGPSTAGPGASGASGAPAGGGGASGGSGGGSGGGGGGVGGGAVPPASGAPAGGAAGSWIVRNVPGVGMIANGMAELRSQQDKDNYYRNIEGGTHGNAIGERFREEGYVLGSSMVFGSEEARQAYKGVTRIGYTNRSDQRAGTTRAQALNYVYEGKKSRGQSVEEGLAQLEVASKTLSSSLETLNTSMENVSESAGKAGVNTEMARRQMLTLMNVGISRGQGAGAAGFAEAITSTNVSYGRDFAARANSSGMYSRDMQYRAASLSGMTQGQLANMTRHDPAGAMGVYQKVIDQSTASAGVTPEMRSWIAQRVTQAGGGQALKNQPLLAEQIANDFLDTYGGSIDQNAFADVMGQLAGTDFGGDPVLAAKFLVEQVGGNTAAAEAKQKQMQVGLTDMSGRMANGTKNAAVSSSLDKFKDLTQIGHGMFARHSKAVDAYTSTAQKSGKRDPVIEALLQSSDVAGTDAMGNSKADQMHVQVQTRSGGRVMSLADAIKEFPNEVAAGKVTFMDGAAKGKSTGDLTGGKIDTTRDWRSEVQKNTKTGASLNDWNGKGTPTTPTGGVFTLGLSPDASKLVKIMDQTGNNGAAAAAGTPPLVDPSGSPTFR